MDSSGNTVNTGTGSTDTITVTLSSQTFSTWLDHRKHRDGRRRHRDLCRPRGQHDGRQSLLVGRSRHDAPCRYRCDLEHLYDFGQFGQQAGLHHTNRGTAPRARRFPPNRWSPSKTAYGNPVTTGSGSTDTIKVTLSSQTFSGGSTTASVTAVGGVATFSGLGVNTTAGSPYTLAASDTTNGAITGATSNTFTISASSANKLAFTIQPGNGTAGSALSTQPKVTMVKTASATRSPRAVARPTPSR